MNRHQIVATLGIGLLLLGGLFLVRPDWVEKRYLEQAIEENRMLVLPTTPLSIGDTVVTAWVATSTRDQAKGLSNVHALTDYQGMLFSFPGEQPRSFWNKGMIMSFDLLWIKEGKVVGIERDIPPYVRGERIVTSPGEVTSVLELAGGWADRHKLQVGDQVSL